MQGERDPRQSPAAPALPVHERIGLSIVATDAADAVNRIVEAERAGLVKTYGADEVQGVLAESFSRWQL